LAPFDRLFVRPKSVISWETAIPSPTRSYTDGLLSPPAMILVFSPPASTASTKPFAVG
jgi:hypothetical protein